MTRALARLARVVLLVAAVFCKPEVAWAVKPASASLMTSALRPVVFNHKFKYDGAAPHGLIGFGKHAAAFFSVLPSQKDAIGNVEAYITSFFGGVYYGVGEKVVPRGYSNNGGCGLFERYGRKTDIANDRWRSAVIGDGASHRGLFVIFDNPASYAGNAQDHQVRPFNVVQGARCDGQGFCSQVALPLSGRPEFVSGVRQPYGVVGKHPGEHSQESVGNLNTITVDGRKELGSVLAALLTLTLGMLIGERGFRATGRWAAFWPLLCIVMIADGTLGFLFGFDVWTLVTQNYPWLLR